VFAVVAPCVGPLPQVERLRCISHQMPTYFPGLIQLDTSPSLFGSLRFSSIWLLASAAALSPIRMVRHGVVKAPVLCASTPSGPGISHAVSPPAPSPDSSIEG